MKRPDLCPDCGASTTAHTGSYCHECGYVLIQPPPVDPRRTLLRSLPASAFPITFRAYRTDNDKLVWEQVVDGPGALEVPALKEREGVPVYVKVHYASEQD